MRKGFTLLELLIVIVILGILASIALPRYFANLEKAREAEAKATLNKVREAEMGYYAEKGTFTATFPINVTLSGDASKPDIYLIEPQSPSFTFTIVNATAGQEYGLATTKVGGVSYKMCLANGKFGNDSLTCP
jgi:prepilin-type N-terminal cleavage/methylation domain-containing protein